MSAYKQYVVPEAKPEEGTMKSYVAGFALSVTLTLVAYFVTVNHVLSGYALIIVLLELAILQFTVQLFLFLHFGKERSPRWKLLTLVMAIVVVLIVVLGSLWIMQSLNYNMSPDRINKYMNQQVGEGF